MRRRDRARLGDYIPEVTKAATPGTQRVYGTYWNRILEHWGHRHLDEPTTLEIQQLAETVRSARMDVAAGTVRQRLHERGVPIRDAQRKPRAGDAR